MYVGNRVKIKQNKLKKNNSEHIFITMIKPFHLKKISCPVTPDAANYGKVLISSKNTQKTEIFISFTHLWNKGEAINLEKGGNL